MHSLFAAREAAAERGSEEQAAGGQETVRGENQEHAAVRDDRRGQTQEVWRQGESELFMGVI